jgi:hypothetical protein
LRLFYSRRRSRRRGAFICDIVPVYLLVVVGTGFMLLRRPLGMLAANRYWPWWWWRSSPFLCLLLLALGFALVSSVQLSIAPTTFLVAICRVCSNLVLKIHGYTNIHTSKLISQFLGQSRPSVDLAHNVRGKSGACRKKVANKSGRSEVLAGFPRVSSAAPHDQHPTCMLQPHLWRVYSTYPHTQWVAST